MNDIKDSTSMKILSFANDTTAYLSRPYITELKQHVNTELVKLNEWICVNL
jgi:hypothetical protein